MARINENSPAWVVKHGPGWVEAGSVADGEATDVSVSVADTRYGPATITTLTLYASLGDLPVIAAAELTLSDTLAVIGRLQSIARQAILDGYGDPPAPESIPETGLDHAAPFDAFEVAMCGEVLHVNPEKSFIERLVGDEDLSTYDRTFWTVYGYRNHTDANLDGEGATSLIDVESEDEALAIARLLAEPGQAIELNYDGMIVNKALDA